MTKKIITILTMVRSRQTNFGVFLSISDAHENIILEVLLLNVPQLWKFLRTSDCRAKERSEPTFHFVILLLTSNSLGVEQQLYILAVNPIHTVQTVFNTQLKHL
jgi:hypothetical protein